MKMFIGLLCALGLSQSAAAITVKSAYKSNLCLDVNRGDPANWRSNTNIEAWPCHGQENQQFNLKPGSPAGSFTIQALGRCLDIDLGYLDSWTHQNNVQLFTCNGGRNQQFTLQSQGNGWFLIRSQLDGRCLDIDLNVNNGWRYERNVQLWECNGDPNQLWKFDGVSGGGDPDVIITLDTH